MIHSSIEIGLDIGRREKSDCLAGYWEGLYASQKRYRWDHWLQLSIFLYRHYHNMPKRPARDLSRFLPSVQGVSAALWIFLLELVPLPRLHRLGIRPLQIILIRLGRDAGLFSTSVNNTAPALLLFQVLVDRHGREVMIGPEHAIPHALALVEQREGLQGFSFFA